MNTPRLPANALVFFEIPVSDFSRALSFYNAVFDWSMDVIVKQDPPRRFAAFPTQEGGVGGALAELADFKPSELGTRVYLDAGPDLATVLARVPASGGKILLPKTELQEHCFYALFLDTEGNQVGLFSHR